MIASTDRRSIDLRQFGAAERANAWRRAVTRFFPGLSVRGSGPIPTAGNAHGLALGAGELWTIRSPALCVAYEPSPPAPGQDCISLMMQRSGVTVATQHGRHCVLHSRDMCFIDDAFGFQLEVAGGLSEFTMVRMPRTRVLELLSELPAHTALGFGSGSSGVALLGALLQKLTETADQLDSRQRARALEAVLQLLELPEIRQPPATRNRSWRAQAAVSFIDTELSDPLLCADRVAAAQQISRRHLDHILQEELGTSISAQIWQRRLLRAADHLRDPRFLGHSITQVAFQCGFEHAAHFTRAFKRSMGCAPSRWRTTSPAN
jgi:AraC family transcriptional regulator, positive regulator of tynA and feaB